LKILQRWDTVFLDQQSRTLLSNILALCYPFIHSSILGFNSWKHVCSTFTSLKVILFERRWEWDSTVLIFNHFIFAIFEVGQFLPCSYSRCV
jgi:hypothetical protein